MGTVERTEGKTGEWGEGKGEAEQHKTKQAVLIPEPIPIKERERDTVLLTKWSCLTRSSATRVGEATVEQSIGLPAALILRRGESLIYTKLALARTSLHYRQPASRQQVTGTACQYCVPIQGEERGNTMQEIVGFN